MALRLSRAGYGTPEEVLATRSDIVILAIEYERFLNDYEAAVIELNKESKK